MDKNREHRLFRALCISRGHHVQTWWGERPREPSYQNRTQIGRSARKDARPTAKHMLRAAAPELRRAFPYKSTPSYHTRRGFSLPQPGSD